MQQQQHQFLYDIKSLIIMCVRFAQFCTTGLWYLHRIHIHAIIDRTDIATFSGLMPHSTWAAWDERHHYHLYLLYSFDITRFLYKFHYNLNILHALCVYAQFCTYACSVHAYACPKYAYACPKYAYAQIKHIKKTLFFYNLPAKNIHSPTMKSPAMHFFSQHCLFLS